MAKAITDKEKISEALTRGVEMHYPDKNSLEKVLMSGKRIKLYCGFDPSASSLHIGNAIQLNKLAQFQNLGHEVIFLIGDFTGMIGDPTDKAATRKKITRKEVLANAKNYKKQASAYLSFSGSNKAKIMYNSKWNDKLNFAGLIDLASNFTVQQMIQRDMFQKRLKEDKPIYLHEFLYPLAQGYDSVAMDVDLEIGGNDQMFNMLAGRNLMKAVKGKEKFVLTIKLLADDKGIKMGKTEGNMVNLDEKPNDMYGKIMSWTDGVIIPGFELCTKIPMEEVEKVKRELAGGKVNPRDFKMKLAYEITKMNYGEKEAKAAQGYFIKIIQKKEIPDEIKTIKLTAGRINIIELLVAANLVQSRTEAKRLMAQGGIKVNGKVVDMYSIFEITNNELLIQRGKRQFVRIIGN